MVDCRSSRSVHKLLYCPTFTIGNPMGMGRLTTERQCGVGMEIGTTADTTWCPRAVVSFARPFTAERPWKSINLGKCACLIASLVVSKIGCERKAYYRLRIEGSIHSNQLQFIDPSFENVPLSSYRRFTILAK